MTDDTAPVRSVAEVKTPNAARYLGQLCKHFAHKLPVSHDAQSGWIGFDFGDCRLVAAGETLTLRLEAPGDTDMARLQDVVARHLVRFAFREPELVVDWRPA
jgi:hypothetical protein